MGRDPQSRHPLDLHAIERGVSGENQAFLPAGTSSEIRSG